MAKRGGWYKHFDDDLDDPKDARLSDFEHRIWGMCLSFCNRSPAILRRQGLLFHAEDFPVEASDFARIRGCSVQKVRAALEKIASTGGKSPLISLENGVIRVTNWRKRQESLDSDYCQDIDETLTENVHNIDAKLQAIRNTEYGIRNTKDVKTKKTHSATTPGCSWCNNPTPWESDSPPSQRIMQAYHDGYRERQTNGKEPDCPVIGKGDGRAWRDLKALLDAGKSPERVRDVILHGLKSENDWIIGQGYSLVAILSNYQGIAEALDNGHQHGAGVRKSGQQDARRHPASPREAFPESGTFEL